MLVFRQEVCTTLKQVMLEDHKPPPGDPEPDFDGNVLQYNLVSKYGSGSSLRKTETGVDPIFYENNKPIQWIVTVFEFCKQTEPIKLHLPLQSELFLAIRGPVFWIFLIL